MMKRADVIACAAAALIALAAAPSPTQAADATGPQSQCQRRMMAKGFPNRIETVASLSAIRIWTQMAKDKHGAEFAMWHNADGKALKCSPVKNSDYIACFATGRPCKASTTGKTAAKAR